jgi:hypothetical protein
LIEKYAPQTTFTDAVLQMNDLSELADHWFPNSDRFGRRSIVSQSRSARLGSGGTALALGRVTHGRAQDRPGQPSTAKPGAEKKPQHRKYREQRTELVPLKQIPVGRPREFSSTIAFA